MVAAIVAVGGSVAYCFWLPRDWRCTTLSPISSSWTVMQRRHMYMHTLIQRVSKKRKTHCNKKTTTTKRQLTDDSRDNNNMPKHAMRIGRRIGLNGGRTLQTDTVHCSLFTAGVFNRKRRGGGRSGRPLRRSAVETQSLTALAHTRRFLLVQVVNFLQLSISGSEVFEK